jgi:hypothetical protein
MDRVDQMDKMDYSALLRPCGPLKTLFFAHLTTEAIPVFFNPVFQFFSGFLPVLPPKKAGTFFICKIALIFADNTLKKEKTGVY